MVRAQLAGAYGTAADTRAADGARARRFSRLPQLALPALLAMALAGCAGGEGLDGAFGAQDTGVARTGTSSAGVVNSATTDALVVGTGPEALTYDCPPVTVRTGAGSWQVTAGGGLRYQGTLGRLARECSISGGTMMVRVGIEGRVLMGEKGTSGQVKVPIRIAVVQEGPSPKTITTKFFNVAVDVPADPGHAAFTVVGGTDCLPAAEAGGDGAPRDLCGLRPAGERGEGAQARSGRQAEAQTQAGCRHLRSAGGHPRQEAGRHQRRPPGRRVRPAARQQRHPDAGPLHGWLRGAALHQHLLAATALRLGVLRLGALTPRRYWLMLHARPGFGLGVIGRSLRERPAAARYAGAEGATAPEPLRPKDRRGTKLWKAARVLRGSARPWRSPKE